MNVKFSTIVIGTKVFKDLQLGNISCEELIEFLSNERVGALDNIASDGKIPEPRQGSINPIEYRKEHEEQSESAHEGQSESAPKKQTEHSGGRPTRPVRVTDLSTGDKKTFKTSTAAADALGVNKSTILYAVRNNSLVKNRYEIYFVDDADKI